MKSLILMLVSSAVLSSTAQGAETSNLKVRAKPHDNPAASMSLQQALDSDLGKVCSLNGQNYAIDPDDEGKCEEMGGSIQAMARKKLSGLRNSNVYQKAAPARKDAGRITVPPDHRLSDPLISPSSRDAVGSPEANERVNP